MVKSGNVSINPESFENSTKEEFVEQFKGKVAHDINVLWDQVCQCNTNRKALAEKQPIEPKNESISEPGKQSKKHKSK